MEATTFVNDGLWTLRGPESASSLKESAGSIISNLIGTEIGRATQLESVDRHITAYIEYTHSATQLGSMVFKQITIRADFVHAGNSSSPFYDTYTTSFLSNDGFQSRDEDILSFDLFAVVGGKTYSSLDNPQLFTPC